MNTTNHTSPSGEELKPCPFCGCTTSPELKGNGIGDNWLECVECGASTRLREDGAGSAKDWNRRATASEQADNAPLTGDIHSRVHRALMAAHPNLAREFAEARAAASAHTIGEDAANVAIGEREAHCVNTCNFYNKNRPCECPAPQSDAAAWEAIFDRVAVELNCLPSSSPDGNEHIFHAIAKLRAALTAEKVAGQEDAFVRAGGGQYEISFAFEAWQQSRREALEEAADLCDQLWNRYGDADECADAIRSLANQKQAG